MWVSGFRRFVLPLSIARMRKHPLSSSTVNAVQPPKSLIANGTLSCFIRMMSKTLAHMQKHSERFIGRSLSPIGNL
jgi:hypothetical protein